MQDSWALFPALPLTHWLISHKSCPASVPQFPYPSDKDNAAPLLGESAGTFLYGSVKDRTHLSHPAPVRETPPPSQSQLAVILRNAQKPLFFPARLHEAECMSIAAACDRFAELPPAPLLPEPRASAAARA